MKTHLLALLLGAAATAAPLSAQVLASWNFDTATISGASTDFGPVAADVGAGSASGHHAAAAATWSAPAGNGSAKSFSVNTWGVGDYFQFQSSSTGVAGLQVSWDQTGSGTGPRDFNLQYSTDGASWTTFGSTYQVQLNGAPNTPWSSSGSPNPLYSFTRDLSGISALDNQASVYFRLTDASTVSLNGGTVATGGTDRVDNFSISVIPEPSTYAALTGAIALAFAGARRFSRGGLRSTT